MPNRILFLVSAVLASLVLCSALPVIPNAAHAADDCLASPDTATSHGGHWRYHIEHGTGRKCWYLAGETAKADQTRSDQTNSDDTTADNAKPASDDADTTASVAPRPTAKIRPSLQRAASSPPDRPRLAKPTAEPAEPAPSNNARAEFIDTPRDGQPAPAAQQPQQDQQQQSAPPQVVAPLLTPQNSVATRWPNPTGTVSADSTAPLTAAPTTALPPAPQPAAEPQPAAAPDQATPEIATDQSAAPPVTTADGPDYLLYALIIALTGFAAVLGFAALRFAADWWRDWREEHRWRRSIPSYTVGRGASMLAMGEVAMGLTPANDGVTPRARAPRVVVDEEPPRRLEDEIDEIEQLLALTREAGGQTQNSARNAPWEHAAPRDAAE